MDQDKTDEKMVLEARLLETYVNPTTGKEERHPRADYFRGEDGKPTNEFRLRGGSQVFSTGVAGGPTVELSFTNYAPLPSGEPGAHLVRYLRTDPLERARVEIIARPMVVSNASLLDDPGIKRYTGEQYTRLRASMAGADDAAPEKRRPGRQKRATA